MEVKIRSVSVPWITPQIRKVVTSDLDKANILNEYFSTIGEKLANELPKTNLTQSNVHVSIVAPWVMSLNISSEGIVSSMAKLRADESSGPHSVAAKLIKFAGDSIIPSLRFVSNISATYNTITATWKAANISALNKRDDEIDKHNYRPFSLLSVPEKLMESMMASTITTHVTGTWEPLPCSGRIKKVISPSCCQ